MGDERGRPLLHEHKTCGKVFDPVMVCSECGEPLHAKQVHVHAGPGRREAVGL
jgi:rRNA maturation endonuclease Nob1